MAVLVPDEWVIMAGVYRNRTYWEPCSNPPLVLKTRAGASRANTPLWQAILSN